MHEAAERLRASPFFLSFDDGGGYSLAVLDGGRIVYALEMLFKSAGEMVEELMRHKTLHCLLNSA